MKNQKITETGDFSFEACLVEPIKTRFKFNVGQDVMYLRARWREDHDAQDERARVIRVWTLQTTDNSTGKKDYYPVYDIRMCEDNVLVMCVLEGDLRRCRANDYGPVSKLENEHDSKSCASGLEGSSPSWATMKTFCPICDEEIPYTACVYPVYVCSKGHWREEHSNYGHEIWVDDTCFLFDDMGFENPAEELEAAINDARKRYHENK